MERLILMNMTLQEPLVDGEYCALKSRRVSAEGQQHVFAGTKIPLRSYLQLSGLEIFSFKKVILTLIFYLTLHTESIICDL